MSFSCKLDWDSQFVCIAEIASKKIETLISYLKFISPEVTF